MIRHLRRAMCMGAMALGLMAASAEAQVVISQVYGGGGNSGATFTHDFIELFNAGNSAVDIGGWSVQQTSATGSGTWAKVDLPVSFNLAPGQYFLIQLAQGTGGTTPLPTPDATGSIAMGATSGKVALVSSTTALTGACPTSGIVDLVGFGSTANCSETAPAPAPSNTNAILRAAGGCTDTGNNSADFATGMPTPRNSMSPLAPCTPTGDTGACCFPLTGACGVLTATDCATQGGNFTFVGQTCAAAMCPQPTGACCVSGVCVGDFTEAVCLSQMGATWGGAGTSCASFMCPIPTGACCLAMGNCMILTQADCTTQSGTWTSSAAATCGPSDCPQTGACCVGTTCTVETFANCDAMTGIWLGRNVACGGSTCVVPANPANVVARYDFDLLRQGTLVLTTTGTMPFPLGDAFNPSQRFRAVPEPVAFTLLDDSTFFNDSLGVIEVGKVDTFFGVTDVQGVIEPGMTDSAEAEFTFDITGRSSLSLSVDLAAMGDFETALGCSMPPCTGDIFSFSAQIDGGAEQLLLQATADEAAMLTYTLESGAMVELADPLVVDGTTTLTNEFATFMRSITGTGSSLKIIVRAQTDGSEAFVFDNIVIMGVTGGAGTGACELPGGGCDVRTEDLCDTAGGNYLGDNTTCPTPCDQADFNNSGNVDATDIFIFLDAWFAQNGMSGPNLSADANNSGNVDATDIFIFLDLWFAQNGMTC